MPGTWFVGGVVCRVWAGAADGFPGEQPVVWAGGGAAGL